MAVSLLLLLLLLLLLAALMATVTAVPRCCTGMECDQAYCMVAIFPVWRVLLLYKVPMCA
jgi:hypothetical protein